MTGYQSKKAAALDEDGIYLARQTIRDQLIYGMSVTQGGKRIDPMSIYKDDDDDDTQVYQRGYAITNAVQPTALTFNGGNSEWVMRITADRRIEVNEGVEVTEAAQKVLDALQHLIKPAQPATAGYAKKIEDLIQELDKWKAKAQRPWVGLTEEEWTYYTSYVYAEILNEIEQLLKSKNT